MQGHTESSGQYADDRPPRSAIADPHSAVQDPNHQRALDRLTLNEVALNDDRAVEGGGLRSTWSPDHEFEGDLSKNSKRTSSLQSLRAKLRYSMHSITEMAYQLRPYERKPVGWGSSLNALVRSSYLNLLLIFVPCSWTLGILKREDISLTLNFVFSFLALIPLCKLLEFGGNNLALYCGKDFGDLIIITLSNAIEAILAMCLLARCELKLLQSTIVGVVLLRLLLIPGISFVIGGTEVAEQELHPQLTQLNQSLLFTSVIILLLPVAFFAALDRGEGSRTDGGTDVVGDEMRGQLLKVSRGMAVLLLVVYICSRWFIHNPLKEKEKSLHDSAPDELKKQIAAMKEREPKMNIWVCIMTLILTVGLLAVTAEWLVESIEPIREGIHSFKVGDEFFGLVLLPACSFSGDALVTAGYFIRAKFFKNKPSKTPHLANVRSIESSIQFILLWLPLVVIIGWCYHRPLTMLFDFYEMAVLLGACFLVNYITADSKVDWNEGAMLVALYAMITLTTWFYPGQPEIMAILQCDTVANYLIETPSVFMAHSPLASNPPLRVKAVGGTNVKNLKQLQEAHHNKGAHNKQQKHGDKQPEHGDKQSKHGNEDHTDEHESQQHLERDIFSDPEMSQKLRRLVALYDVLVPEEDL